MHAGELFPPCAAKIQIEMEQIMQPMIRLLFSAAICTNGLMRIIYPELKPEGSVHYSLPFDLSF